MAWSSYSTPRATPPRHVIRLGLRLGLLLGLGLGLSGLQSCSSLATPPATHTQALEMATLLLEQKDPDTAVLVLDYHDRDLYVHRDLEHWKLLMGTALFRAGEAWDAFWIIQDFTDEHLSSPFEPEIASLEYQIGASLVESDGGFLIFYSDRDRGRRVLEHFTVHFPYSSLKADALRWLGEIAYSDGDYDLAEERFSQLITQHQDSDWLTLASFRVAMCLFLKLEGPDYDLQAMTRAHNELRDFLAVPTENPKFKAEAEAALRTVRGWLAEKHVLIGRFYATVGNTKGHHHHIRIAATEYPGTEAGRRARLELERILEDEAQAGSRSTR